MSSEQYIGAQIAALAERLATHEAELNRHTGPLAEIDEKLAPIVAASTATELRSRECERCIAAGEGISAGLALRCDEIELRLEQLELKCDP